MVRTTVRPAVLVMKRAALPWASGLWLIKTCALNELPAPLAAHITATQTVSRWLKQCYGVGMEWYRRVIIN